MSNIFGIQREWRSPVAAVSLLVSTFLLTACQSPEDHLAMYPVSGSVEVGQSQRYNATLIRRDGTSGPDVTTEATFTISPNGKCQENRCIAESPGAYTVTATARGFTGTASLTVSPSNARKSTAEILDSAVSRGEIDLGTAIVYQVLADFGDSRLPETYRGQVDEESVGLTAARQQTNLLTDAQQRELAPFFVPAIYADSWYNLPTSAARSSVAATQEGAVIAAVPFTEVCSSDHVHVIAPFWKPISVTAGPSTFTVWYNGDKPGQSSQAQIVAKTLPAVLDTMVSVHGFKAPIQDDPSVDSCAGRDSSIDITLSTIEPRGQADCVGAQFIGKTCPAHIDLPLDAGTPRLQALTAHEVTHAIEFAYDFNAPSWWNEATSKWAEGAVFKSYTGRNDEFTADRITRRLDQPLTPTDEAYANYTFPLYLTHQVGTAAVAGVWQRLGGVSQSGSHATLDAINAIQGGIDGMFPEYALTYMNRGGRTWGDPDITDSVLDQAPYELAMGVKPQFYAHRKTSWDDVPPLSAQFTQYPRTSDDHALSFRLTTPLKGLKVFVISRKGETYSQATEVTSVGQQFCFDSAASPTNPPDTIYLAFTNSTTETVNPSQALESLSYGSCGLMYETPQINLTHGNGFTERFAVAAHYCGFAPDDDVWSLDYYYMYLLDGQAPYERWWPTPVSSRPGEPRLETSPGQPPDHARITWLLTFDSVQTVDVPYPSATVRVVSRRDDITNETTVVSEPQPLTSLMHNGTTYSCPKQ